MNRKIISNTLLILVFFSFLVPAVSYAVDIKTTVSNEDLIKKKQSESNKYLTAVEAHNVVKQHADEVLFVDVRTLAEIEFVGWTAMVDAVIPYMSNDFDEWNKEKYRYLKVINGDFPIEFEDLMAKKGLTKDAPVIFMCRSGTRSSRAASLASKLGYTNAYTVVDGFEGDKAKEGSEKGHRVVNGWKNSDAPWDYKVDINRVLFNQ